MKRSAVRKEAPPDFGERWTCVSCDDLPIGPMDKLAFLAHLVDVHKVAAPFKGQRSMTLHLDAADHYISLYTWTLECGVEAAQNIVGPRHGLYG